MADAIFFSLAPFEIVVSLLRIPSKPAVPIYCRVRGISRGTWTDSQDAERWKATLNLQIHEEERLIVVKNSRWYTHELNACYCNYRCICCITVVLTIGFCFHHINMNMIWWSSAYKARKCCRIHQYVIHFPLQTN